MLVLSRKKQESIVLGNGVTITVVRIKGNRVQIGIEAPDDVIIRRGELPPRSSTSGQEEAAPRSTASQMDLVSV